MLSEFGKEVRKLRIDRSMKLKDLADALGVSSAYLSAVEAGRKSVPSTWLEEIGKVMRLNSEELERLKRAIAASARSISVSLSGSHGAQRELATAFARRFPNLSDDEVKRMLKILGSRT